MKRKLEYDIIIFLMPEDVYWMRDRRTDGQTEAVFETCIYKNERCTYSLAQ